jgi:hypothetical protein
VSVVTLSIFDFTLRQHTKLPTTVINKSKNIARNVYISKNRFHPALLRLVLRAPQFLWMRHSCDSHKRRVLTPESPLPNAAAHSSSPSRLPSPIPFLQPTSAALPLHREPTRSAPCRPIQRRDAGIPPDFGELVDVELECLGVYFDFPVPPAFLPIVLSHHATPLCPR